jgi:cell division protein FtsQ
MRLKLRPWLRRFRKDLLGWSRFALVSLLCTAAVAGGAFGAYAAIWPAVVRHSYFQLRSVKVISDSRVAEPGVLASRAGLYDGTSLWEVDAHSAAAALATAGWVRSARVSRRFPGHVSVEVLSREPIAATVSADGPYLIDATGYVYREEESLPYADLPYLTGWESSGLHAVRVARLAKSIELMKAAAANGLSLSQVHVDEAGVYWLYPDYPPLAVRLGDDPEPRRAVAKVRAVLETLSASAPEGAELDLVYPDRAVLHLPEGEVRAVVSTLGAGRQEPADGSEQRG